MTRVVTALVLGALCSQAFALESPTERFKRATELLADKGKGYPEAIRLFREVAVEIEPGHPMQLQALEHLRYIATDVQIRAAKLAARSGNPQRAVALLDVALKEIVLPKAEHEKALALRERLASRAPRPSSEPADTQDIRGAMVPRAETLAFNDTQRERVFFVHVSDAALDNPKTLLELVSGSEPRRGATGIFNDLDLTLR